MPLAIILTSAAIALQVASAPAQSSVPVSHSPAEYVQVWNKVDSAIKNMYYARDKDAAKLKRALDDAKPKAIAAKTDAEFGEVVDNLVHSFGDSHFDFYTKSDQGYYLMDSLARQGKADPLPNVGAIFESTPKGSTVTMVLDGTEAAKAGLRRGDVVVSADGKPFQPIMSFAGNESKKVALEVLRDGKTLSMTVTPSDDDTLAMFYQASVASEKRVKVGGKTYGYVHLWTLAQPRFAELADRLATGSYFNTDGFILDIRNGYGGRPEGVIDAFTRPSIDIQWIRGKAVNDEHLGYDKPVVLMIDHGSRSAKEVVAAIFKDSKRATLVGQTTKGAVLGTFPNRVADWAYLEEPVIDLKVDGKRLEKVGVSPNIVADSGYDSKGDDLTFEKSVEVIEKLTGVKNVVAP